MIIELLSDSTAESDKNTKMAAYQNQLLTPEYYWFDPYDPEDFAGFERQGGVYRPMPFDSRHRLISTRLGLALTRWHGVYHGEEAVWLRWDAVAGELLPSEEEISAAAKVKAEQAKQELFLAKAEIERLQALLRKNNA